MNVNLSGAIKKAESYLSKIASQNGKFKALNTVKCENDILQDLKKAFNTESELNGIMGVIKDNICTLDLPTSCSSSILKDYMSPYEATCVKQLKESGMIVIGKSNMDEFGMGSSNTFSCYGSTINPCKEFENDTNIRNLPHTTGGSSGGSAGAVSAGFCDVALGTDTGGSVRLPASYCGVVGFKPSYGVISRLGVVAYSQSLDTVGIITRLEKFPLLRSVFNILSAKNDPDDPTSLSDKMRRKLIISNNNNNNNNSNSNTNKKYKIGIPIQFNPSELSDEVRKAWELLLEKLHNMGHSIYIINLPSAIYSLPAYYCISTAEASSNLARYDGIRYGNPATNGINTATANINNDLGSSSTWYAATRGLGFGKEVRRRIILGSFSLSAGEYESHFLKAQRVRRLVQKDFDNVFSTPNPLHTKDDSDNSNNNKNNGLDFIIGPTSTTSAPTLQEVANKKSPVDSYVNDVLTASINLAGIPAISLPFSNTKEPIGFQIIGQYGNDTSVLNFAESIIPHL